MNQEDMQFMKQFMIVLGALTAFTLVIFFLARYLMAANEISYEPLVRAQVEERLGPAGAVNTGKAPAPKAAGAGGGAQAQGQQTYVSTCAACHDTGAAGAPMLTDTAAWEPRIKQGEQTLYQHAINGVRAMPPKGGDASLSDAQVKAAVDYMVGKVSGGGEPAAASGQASAQAKQVYDNVCSACHAAGVANAPRYGDKAAWKPHLAEGKEHLYQSAIQGDGAMPPKGGNPSLSDKQVKAAVDYMLNAVQ